MQRGGAERQAACIIQNCDAFEHWLVTLHYDQDNYMLDRSKLLILGSRQFVSRLKEFNSIVRDKNPDLIYAWGVLPYILATVISLGKRCKVINGSIRHGVFKGSFSGYLRLILLHLSKYVVANSQAGIRANKLNKGLVLYNGIDERFNRTKTKSPTEKNPRPDKLVMISVANLVPYKDYETVFKALSKLLSEGLDFSYVIIGDGSKRISYEDMARTLGLKDHVVFLGRIANPEDYLAKSDIFIHSSKGEGCSNAILEAMYMGLPIIATDTGGTAEITGSNAILFPYQDTEALYQAIIGLMQDEVRRSMGDESYRLVSQRFTITRMISDYSRLIKAVATNKLNEVADLMYYTNE
jgi:glycosyltransferase involved in cell wall biosynthesis